MVMQNLVNYIFLSLSSAIINVVPILYGMFKVLSNIQIVDYNDSSNIIFNVWNNLYILLSVLILFAIAIKLVNAIVNPDVLTDNKKGVKKAFFNALISVFLVVLLPFVFRGFHEIQSHILNNDIIPKFVFQSETQEDGGNMLAWMAISSTIDLEAFDEIDLIGDLDLVEYGEGTGIYIPADPEEHDPKWLLTELSILRPWANPVIQAGIDAYLDIHPVVLFIFLVATIYELLILVLDTALRTFKLLLLEMMTPIVLGAYVFKSEILKSWALEYIKTFLQIFLLVLALCFMEYMVPLVSGLLQIDGIFHMPKTFLIIGIFRLLLYIGLLRLVKQIGPLINKIFGTNIQGKGGIKGRLGEMAAVGGIAQKAWSSLGNTAKNAGKLALLAPGALGFAGANKLYKSKHEGKSLMDTKAFRQGKGILQGARTALKTGNPLQAYEAYDKGSAAPSYTPGDRMKAQKASAQQMREDIKKKTGYDLIDNNGNLVNLIRDAQGNTFMKDNKGNNIYVPQAALNQANDIMYEHLMSGRFGDAGKEKARQLRAQEIKTGIDGLISRQNGAISSLTKFADTPANSNRMYTDEQGNTMSAAEKAGIIANKIRDGKNLTEDDHRFLRAFGQNSNIEDAVAYYRKLQNESVALKTRFSEYDGNTGSVGLGILSGQQEGIMNDAKQQYEIAKGKMSVVDQDALAFVETSLNNSFKTLNGSYQNNASIYSLLERPSVDPSGNLRRDASGNVMLTDTNLHFNESTGEFYTTDPSTPVSQTKDVTEYVQLIKHGIVTTSVNDYHLDTNANDAVAFANIVSDVTAKAGTVEYYKELHQKIRQEFADRPEIIASVDRIEQSGFLPTSNPEPVTIYEPEPEPVGEPVIQVYQNSGSGPRRESNGITVETDILENYKGEYEDIVGRLKEYAETKIHTPAEVQEITALQDRKKTIERLSGHNE